MKIALPYLDGKVNPHFGTSRKFVVIDTVNRKITDKKIITNEAPHNHSQLTILLKSEGAEVVIAGVIGKPMEHALYNAGFGVLTGASGDVEQVAGDFLNGTLFTSMMKYCSCYGHQHCHKH